MSFQARELEPGKHAELDAALVRRLPEGGRWRVLLDERLAGMASRIVAKVRRDAS